MKKRALAAVAVTLLAVTACGSDTKTVATTAAPASSASANTATSGSETGSTASPGSQGSTSPTASAGTGSESGSTASPGSQGSTSPTASAGTGSGTGNSMADAQARVDAASVEPTGAGIDKPLSRKPDPGKNIYFLQCGVGVCKAIGDEHEKAAKLLGWNLIRIDMGTTGEQIVSAWNRLATVSPAPDAVITSGVPMEVYKSQLADLKSRGIPVVDYAAANPTGDDGIIFDVLPPEDNETRGRLMADFVATQSKGQAKVLFLNVPDYPVLVLEQKAFEKHLAELCSSCTVEVSNFSATDIGGSIPAAVVSYLQSHPDTNWVVPSFDDMHLGVSEAIVAAGFGDKVKMISQNGAVHAVDNILNGRVQVASIPQGPGQVGFKAIDALARHFNGDSLDADTAHLLPIWLQTKATITDPKNPWAGAPGYEDIFAKLWLVK